MADTVVKKNNDKEKAMKKALADKKRYLDEIFNDSLVVKFD